MQTIDLTAEEISAHDSGDARALESLHERAQILADCTDETVEVRAGDRIVHVAYPNAS